MKNYEFEVTFFKTIKASSMDNALEILTNKTNYINECKKITLLDIGGINAKLNAEKHS